VRLPRIESRRAWASRLKRAAALLLALSSLLACSKPSVKIGLALALTGVTAYRGVAARSAIELAADEANASGGIRGRKVELISRDDADLADKALAADNELMDLGVVAIVGHTASAAAVPVLALANERQVPIVSPSASAKTFSGKDDYFFRTCGIADPLGTILGDWAARKGLRKVAVALDISNESYSRALFEAFKAVFESRGGRIASLLPFSKAPENDYAAFVDALLEPSPDGIFCVSSAFQCASVCQTLAKRGKKIQVIAPMGVMTADLFQFGGKTVDGLVISSYFDPGSRAERYVRFKLRYEATYGREPDQAACQGYDAMAYLMESMRRASRLDGPGIREALRGLRSFEALQDERRIDEFGDAAQSPTLYVAEDGRFVAMGGN
jgi:branched-chain amino acid transport system substrate-binding protein